MLLRKHGGGCTIAGIEWPEDGAVAEVPDELGAELLAIDPAGFEHVPDEPEPDGPKRPNQNASAEDWKAYALASGLPEDVANGATRKAIIDHFTGGQVLVAEDTGKG